MKTSQCELCHRPHSQCDCSRESINRYIDATHEETPMTTPNSSPTPPDQSRDAKIMSVLRDIVVVDENHRLDVVEGGLAKIAECFAPDQSLQGGGANDCAAMDESIDWALAAAKQLRVHGISDEHVAAVILSHAPSFDALKKQFADAVVEWTNCQTALAAAKQEVEEARRKQDEAIKAHGFVWNAARKAAQYFRWAGCRDTIAIEAMNQCCEAEKLTPAWSTDWVIVTPLELATLRAQLARQQGQRNEGEGELRKALQDLLTEADSYRDIGFDTGNESERLRLASEVARELLAAPSRPATGNDKPISQG